MKKTITQKIPLPKVPDEAENLRARVVGKKVEVSYQIEVSEPRSQETRLEEIKGTKEWLDKYFPVVRASTLSLDDEILKHKPKTDNQNDFKERLEEAIKSGLQDFRAPIMDPSFDEYGNICYKAGRMPAVGKSAAWWEIKAKEFLPEKGSRLGLPKKERDAFLALFMKELMEECGYTISNAWKAVCDQSQGIGHYWKSEDYKYHLEPTGNRKVGKWYDLLNTYKITKNEAGGVSIFGGDFDCRSIALSLAYVCWDSNVHNVHNIGVGWIVLSV